MEETTTGPSHPLPEPLQPVYFSEEVTRIFHKEHNPLHIATQALIAWNLTPIALAGQGALAVCLLCKDTDGNELVLKAGSEYELIESEYEGLRLWEKSGIFPVPYKNHAPSKERPAYTMEYLHGTKPADLTAATDEDAAWLTRVAYDLWAQWQQQEHQQHTASLQTADHAFSRRADWCQKRLASTTSPRPYANCVNDALEAAVRLSTAPPVKSLCHGDYSPRNLLLAGPLSTHPSAKACDPFAYYGDPVADLGNWAAVFAEDPTDHSMTKALHTIATVHSEQPMSLNEWATIHAVFEANLAPRPHNGATAWLDTNYHNATTLKDVLRSIA